MFLWLQKQFVLNRVYSDGECLKDEHSFWKADKEIVLRAIKSPKNGWKAFQYADLSLKTDQELLLAAKNALLAAIESKALIYKKTLYEWKAFQDADPSLKTDKNFVLTALQKQGRILEYLSDTFKNDKEIAITAVKNTVFAVPYVGSSLVFDKDIALAAVSGDLSFYDKQYEIYLKEMQNEHGLYSYQYTGHFPYKSYDIGNNFSYIDIIYHKLVILGHELKQQEDKISMLVLVKKNAAAIATSPLAKDKNFVLEALNQNSKVFEYIDSSLKEDKEILLTALNCAIKENPKDAAAYNKRSQLKKELGKIKEALQDADEAITSLGLKTEDAYKNRAQLHIKLGNFQLAIDDYTAAINLNPKNPECLAERAFAYTANKQYEDAEKDWSEVIRTAPFSAEYHIERGLVYIELQQYEAAAKDFSIAIKAQNKSSDVYLFRAKCYIELFREAQSNSMKKNYYDLAVSDLKQKMLLDGYDASLDKQLAQLEEEYNSIENKKSFLQQKLSEINPEFFDLEEKIPVAGDLGLFGKSKEKILETEHPVGHFCCKSKKVMVDPVMLVETSLTYERKVIETWLQNNDTCPNTGVKLTSKTLVSNDAIKKSIVEVNEKNALRQKSTELGK